MMLDQWTTKKSQASVIPMALLAALLSGCGQAPEPSTAQPSPDHASSSAATSIGSPDTVGGVGIVSDTTFSSGPSQQAWDHGIGQTPGELLTEEPTSAGLPRDTELETPPAVLSDVDRRFLAAASRSNAYEIALARLGFDQAKEPEVKLFAQRLTVHHLQVQQKLQRLASSQGLDLPAGLPSDRQALVDQLSRASGNEFDARLLHLLGIEAQQADITLYGQAADGRESPVVRDLAQALLPASKRHLGTARELQRAQALAQTANPMP